MDFLSMQPIDVIRLYNHLDDLFNQHKEIVLNEAIKDLEQGLLTYNKDIKDGSETGMARDRGFNEGWNTAIKRLCNLS